MEVDFKIRQSGIRHMWDFVAGFVGVRFQDQAGRNLHGIPCRFHVDSRIRYEGRNWIFVRGEFQDQEVRNPPSATCRNLDWDLLEVDSKIKQGWIRITAKFKAQFNFIVSLDQATT